MKTIKNESDRKKVLKKSLQKWKDTKKIKNWQIAFNFIKDIPSNINNKKKKRRSAPGPLGDFCIVSFKNSVSFYFVKKIRKLPSVLYGNCL